MPNLSARISIRDPVHGTIILTSLEERIIDTPVFQRLRHVKQLALTHLTYPGAHHARFEHSLGTLCLADRMARALELGEDEISRVRLAALLHDVGHMPFSHDSEEVVGAKLGNHEARGQKIICSSPVSDVLSEQETPKTVADYARGKSYGQLIASDVGADRIDYLLRDAHYTGVAYGVIDWERLITTILWQNSQLMLSEGGLQAAESLILARYAMFHTIYYHHSVRIARLMVQEALREALADSTFDWAAAQMDGDGAMLERLSRLPLASPWVLRIRERRLFKRAAVLPWNKLDKKIQGMARDGSLLSQLKKSSGCDVLLDLPGSFISKPSIQILMPDGPKSLSQASVLLSALETAAAERATLLVCSKEGDVPAVSKAVKEMTR